MHKLVFSPQANADLTDLGDYIAIKLRNPQSALALILKIKKEVYALEHFPEMGVPLSANGDNTPYRYLLCGKYMVFYHRDNDTGMLDRVLYGRRDYLALLFGDETDD